MKTYSNIVDYAKQHFSKDFFSNLKENDNQLSILNIKFVLLLELTMLSYSEISHVAEYALITQMRIQRESKLDYTKRDFTNHVISQIKNEYIINKITSC